MAEPKQKLSRTRRTRRRHRINYFLELGIICPQCKERVKRHQVCTQCGFYKNEKIL